MKPSSNKLMIICFIVVPLCLQELNLYLYCKNYVVETPVNAGVFRPKVRILPQKEEYDADLMFAAENLTII